MRDAKLFKQFATIDHESFVDHHFVIEPKADRLMGSVLFMLRGKQWRDMRVTLSPTFTGSKMRRMFALIQETCMDSVGYLVQQCGTEKTMHTEMYDFNVRTTHDLIASCGFGLKVNSHVDRSNEILLNAFAMKQYLLSFTATMNLMCHRFFPWAMKALRIEFFTAKMRQTFYDQMLSNMKKRYANRIDRPDFIDTLMRLRKEYKASYGNESAKDWTDDELLAQCYVFMLGGFDTVTYFLTRATYRIAINAHVQHRLLDEIDEVTSSLSGQPMTYDALKSMKYLDMTLSEVLRIDPPVTYTDRRSTKAFDVAVDDSKTVRIEKFSEIWIPIYCIHNNPEYYPDPDHFDPERFNDDNKATNSVYFMPFGGGPRMCIANRLAMIETKTMLYYLLKEFRLDVAADTEIPMKTMTSFIGAQPVNPFYLTLVKRN